MLWWRLTADVIVKRLWQFLKFEQKDDSLNTDIVQGPLSVRFE